MICFPQSHPLSRNYKAFLNHPLTGFPSQTSPLEVLQSIFFLYYHLDFSDLKALLTAKLFLTDFQQHSQKYPELSQIMNLDVKTEVWGVGTKYFKLAKDYYGSEEYWWVIAWYNLKPLETDFKPGDVVYIPTPLQDILSIYGLF